MARALRQAACRCTATLPRLHTRRDHRLGFLWDVEPVAGSLCQGLPGEAAVGCVGFRACRDDRIRYATGLVGAVPGPVLEADAACLRAALRRLCTCGLHSGRGDLHTRLVLPVARSIRKEGCSSTAALCRLCSGRDNSLGHATRLVGAASGIVLAC